ncbi:hypothetical protein V1264_010305 [Littorina saxatilis]|uniref:Uncharacterized protein n=1 Tax=Littorina saxatilis TaxID=31220 RepID=A0AAN9AP12_9CAEN
MEEAQAAGNEAGGTVHRPVSLPPPKSYDGTPASWPKWRQRFQRYRNGSALAAKPKQQQVSVFLYTMGETADDILLTMNIDEADDATTYETLLTAFNTHFDTQKNIIVERAKFNKRVQKAEEGVEAFIQDLHKLAEDCSFGTLKEELIRDRIVVGVLNDSLSNDLQSQAKLTLVEAIRLSRQAEACKESQPLIRPGENTTAVNEVKRHGHQKHPYGERSQQHQRKNPNMGNNNNCGYCRDRCPARNTTCTKCLKKGHYQAVFRSGTPAPNRWRGAVQELSEEESDDENDFLGHIYHLEDQDYLSAQILVDNKPHIFKLDSGASVSVIGESWAETHKMHESKKQLRGPGNTKLTVLGTVQAQMQHKDKIITETLYVLKGQSSSLLSRTACTKLGLILRVDNVSGPEKPDFKGEFPTLFLGLGNLRVPHSIVLNPDINPTSIYAPRKIPHPLVPKVKKEIDRMLAEGVISPVIEPTSWCSGIVVVPKPNGSIRICVDLTQLNTAVKREVHPS